VIWYSSNDVGSNKAATGVKNILQFVMNNLDTNIIVVRVPYRYVLPMSSGVNREVSLFNKKLEKCLNSFNCVTLISDDWPRKNYTKHGMHLNILGKSNMVKQIVKCVYSLIDKVAKAPIELDWENKYNANVNEVMENDLIGVTLVAEAVTVNNVDKHTRRKPVTRSSNFLWEN
jgi:hypothetical protein